MLFDEIALPLILKNEGVEFDSNGKVTDSGYVNNPNDSGGETNYGITQNTYDSTKVKSIKHITLPEVQHIYKSGYWDACKCDDISTIDSAIAVCVFDHAVNAGVSGALRILQECLGVTTDGIIGSETLRALQKMNPYELLGKYIVRRQRFYAVLVQQKPHNLGFLVGWILRCVRVYNEMYLYLNKEFNRAGISA